MKQIKRTARALLLAGTHHLFVAHAFTPSFTREGGVVRLPRHIHVQCTHDDQRYLRPKATSSPEISDEDDWLDWNEVPGGNGPKLTADMYEMFEDTSDSEEVSIPYKPGQFSEVAISQEYSELCQAQFEVVSDMLGAERATVFLRAAHPLTGALEFRPVANFPRTRRRFIGRDGPSGLEAEEGPRELAGYSAADILLPTYPFMATSGDGCEACTKHADGGLTCTMIYGGMAVGVLAVWKGEDEANFDNTLSNDDDSFIDEGCSANWSEKDCRMLQNVANTLALAAVLDQKERWEHQMQLDGLRRALAETLHQVKNPLTAVRTFGKLLLRRLPAEDSLNRELARDLLTQSDRLVDLLLPVDSLVEAARRLPAPALGAGAGPGAEQELEVGSLALAALLPAPAVAATAGGGEAGGGGAGAGAGAGLEMVWVDEALGPVLSAAAAIAERDGVRLTVLAGGDPEGLPGVRASERLLQEAVSNVLDNALKYVLLGGEAEDRAGWAPAVVVRIRASTAADAAAFGGGAAAAAAAEGGVVVEVVDNGPGIPPEEAPRVFERGFRGVATRGRAEGSGLGLGIAQELMAAVGGGVAVESAQGWGPGGTGGGGTRVALFVPRRAPARTA